MKKTILAAMLGLTVSTASVAAETVNTQEQQRVAVEQRLVDAFGPRLQVKDVTAVAAKQMLEVILVDGSVVHMTPDMGYFIYRDELYQLAADGPVNVTQSRLNPRRAEQLAAIDNSQTVLFPAKGEQKGLINVFTDIDCGYCQKLHQEIPRLNELGISVRYLAYPRAGVKNPQTGALTDSYRKINYVWCQDDRKEAMTVMKNTQRELGMLAQRMRGGDARAQDKFEDMREQMQNMVAASNDCGAPVAAQFELGQGLGVTGTPAIIVDDGRLFPGYMPADALAERVLN
jgi:thiol:disulfide interchange protein DsbC